jgi:uncharacterized RDD family membrane protein YckC
VAPPAPPVHPGAAGGPATRTPDGVPLASWGARLGAYVLDSLLVSAVGAVLSLPFLLDAVESYLREVDRVTRAAEGGESLSFTQTFDVYGWSGGSFLVVSLVTLLVGMAYHVLLLRTRGATVGMQAVGLRVRTWEPQPGPLPWRSALVRWAAFYGVGVLAVIPLVGLLTGTYTLLAGLWPLWDARRQGLHDKAAGTVVVRPRP